jgi:hypothetical protein
MDEINQSRLAQLAEMSGLDKVSPLILCAPNTLLDPKSRGSTGQIPVAVLKYFKKNVVKSPWLNQLLLVVLIHIARNLEPSSIYSLVSLLHKRFAGFSRARATRFDDMKVFNDNVDETMRLYLSGVVLQADTKATRSGFYSRYQTMAELGRDWLMGLPVSERPKYIPFLLAGATHALHFHLLDHSGIQRDQKASRKAEVDALMPIYPEMRREVHMRFNKIARLKQAYDEFLSANLVEQDHPLSFTYSDDVLQFKFNVWSQKSFLANFGPKGGSGTLPSTILHLEKIVRVADNVEVDIREELWFYDLLCMGVTRGTVDPDAIKWLKSWGYAPSSFKLTQPGLISWSAASYMFAAQRKLGGLLIPISELYVSAGFGLLAVDLFTTTGIRLNEALQISLDKECFVRLEIPVPPGAISRTPTVRYTLRVVPKGERTDRREDNFIGEETKRLLVKTAKMLSQHYDLSDVESLPVVPFDFNHRRAHRFAPARYIFQLNKTHLSSVTLRACVRLMLHGMDVRDGDGRAVAVRPHLLRHAFATHAVQVEKIPVDIVGKWLHQKSVGVTGYYSQATDTMIADASDRDLAAIASHIDVKSAVERSPEDLRRLYEDSVSKTGTLATVVGGSCGSHGLCQSQLACIGCSAKVPDPAKRDQVLHQRDWASRELKFYRNEGLMPAARRLEVLIKDANAELREMDQIEEYRADECRKGYIEVKNENR